jgi:hypothetical protein
MPLFLNIVSFVTGGFSKALSAISKLLKWLLANPAAFLAFVFCIAFVLVVLSKDHEIATLQKDVADRDARISIMTTAAVGYRENAAKLTATLGEQNATLLALQKQGLSSSARFDQIMTAQQTASVGIARKIAALDKATPDADKCASALALIRSNAQ